MRRRGKIREETHAHRTLSTKNLLGREAGSVCGARWWARWPFFNDAMTYRHGQDIVRCGNYAGGGEGARKSLWVTGHSKTSTCRFADVLCALLPQQAAHGPAAFSDSICTYYQWYVGPQRHVLWVKERVGDSSSVCHRPEKHEICVAAPLPCSRSLLPPTTEGVEAA